MVSLGMLPIDEVNSFQFSVFSFSFKS